MDVHPQEPVRRHRVSGWPKSGTPVEAKPFEVCGCRSKPRRPAIFARVDLVGLSGQVWSQLAELPSDVGRTSAHRHVLA